MKTILLLVTIFTPGQPTTNYQVAFNSRLTPAQRPGSSDALAVRRWAINALDQAVVGARRLEEVRDGN